METLLCPATRDAPQAVVSPVRAAGEPAMTTLAEPETMGVVP